MIYVLIIASLIWLFIISLVTIYEENKNISIKKVDNILCFIGILIMNFSILFLLWR